MNITKGNWYAVENDYYIDIKVDGNPIAQVIKNEFVDTDKNTMRANAKLMECAPEMYDYLLHMIEHDVINDPSIEREVKSLLAKARGES